MDSTEDSSTGSHQPQLPPGFRFHPTDEELVVHYLKNKAASAPLPAAIVADIDIYKFDPWELPAKATFGEEEWYFFSPRDRKYPNGARPNRAATSGYWKATGTDKAVVTGGGTQKVGVKKALVFYRGKPPKGMKTSWIMHEYRLADNKSVACKSKTPAGCDLANKKVSLRLDDWVLCRIFKKSNTNRLIDQEKDLFPSISVPWELKSSSNYCSLMEDDQSLYGWMNPDSAGSASKVPFMVAAAAAPSPNCNAFPWNIIEEGNNAGNLVHMTRRFPDDSCGGGTEAAAMAAILNNYQQQAAVLNGFGEEGLYMQQQAPYEVSGINWNS